MEVSRIFGLSPEDIPVESTQANRENIHAVLEANSFLGSTTVATEVVFRHTQTNEEIAPGDFNTILQPDSTL